MTVSSATAASAATQAYQTTHSANNAKTAGSAFSAVASQSDLLPGISATGGSALSSNMLSALLGMNSSGSAAPTTPTPNSGTGQRHHGIETYVDNLPG